MILTVLTAVIGLSICGGLVKLGLIYLNSYRILLRSKCFRGPRAFPFIGNAHLIAKNSGDFPRKLQEITIKYQSPFKIWFGPYLFICIEEPEHVKLILTNPSARGKPPYYNILKPMMGDGLVTAEVSKWIPHRKAIEPLFSRNVLESFIKMFESNASIMAEKIGMEGERTEIDIRHYVERYTFDTICGTTFGTCVNIANEECLSLFQIIKSAQMILSSRMTRPWLHYDFIFKHTSMAQQLYKGIEYSRNVLEKVLIGEKHDIEKALTTKPRNSLLGLLLTLPEDAYKFADEEIRDELVTVIGAGYDTTATTLSLVLFMLASYPDIQDKVYAEVSETYGVCKSKGLDITMQDLDRMVYLDRVLKETLRFFPIVPILARSISEDINMGDFTLPVGSSVLINLHSIHRSEKYWPKPLEFIPDRFLPGHPLGPRHPSAYLPFSLGTRKCIGSKYATTSLKISLATLLSKYIIKTTTPQEAKDIELEWCITMEAKYPIMISLERRFSEVD